MSATKSDILELLASGKITAADAADMLATIGQDQPETAVASEPEVAKVMEIEVEEEVVVSEKTPTWLHVRVNNLETGKNRVTVNIPIRMLNWGLRLGRRFTSELDDLDWDEINNMMVDMKSGMLVEVQDQDSKEHVQVYLD